MGSAGLEYWTKMQENGQRYGNVGRELLLRRAGYGHMSGPQAINIENSYSSCQQELPQVGTTGYSYRSRPQKCATVIVPGAKAKENS